VIFGSSRLAEMGLLAECRLLARNPLVLSGGFRF
jgi:hypothetical protein